jgi:hypothetical protein
VKFFSPEGKHMSNADYHTDDLSDAHDTAKGQLNRYKKGGNVKRYEDGDRVIASETARMNAEKEAERKENEGMRDMILGAPRRALDSVKGMFGSTPKPAGSITKTEKSVTVAPGRKRGGSAMC